MKKWTALLLAGLLVFLCGCDALFAPEQPSIPTQTTAPATPTKPDFQQVDLTVWVLAEDVWADAETVDALLGEFNAYYPNIVAHVEHHREQDLATAKPDILLADAAFLGECYTQGSMADLAECWASGLEEDVYSVVAGACKGENGAYHTVPMGMNIACMAVNTAILSGAEAMEFLNTANHTWNTSSFLSAVQLVYENNLDTVGTIFCKDETREELVRLLVCNLYDGDFVENKTGAYTVSADKMNKALAALAEQPGIVLDPASGPEDALQAFLDGKTAFTVNWSSALQTAHAKNSEILFMNFPSADSRPETVAQTFGFGIFDNGDPVKLAAAKTFVAHMSSSAPAIQATRLLSVRASMEAVYEGTDQGKQMKELAKLIPYLKDPEPTSRNWDQARKIWLAMLQNMAKNPQDWKTAQENAQRDLNSLFPELFPPETAPSNPIDPTQ